MSATKIKPKFIVPPDEAQRLAALRELQILDTEREREFTTIVELANRIFETDISAISLVDHDRQWFKAITGLDAQETPREVAFCAHAILSDATLIVPDAEADPRFRDNPLVTGGPRIRFYAGAPLSTRQGSKIGTLCVIGSRARIDWTERTHTSMLQDMAEWVCIELDRRSRRLGLPSPVRPGY